MLKGIRKFYIVLDKEQWKLDMLLDLFGILGISEKIAFSISVGFADEDFSL